MLDKNSRLKEVLKNPVGHDVIAKVMLQSGMNENILKNRFLLNMRLSTMQRLVPNIVDDSFLKTLFGLINSETDIPDMTPKGTEPSWWKEAVFYQIYPSSFCDSNEDGIGDINGIISKLDYLRDLGINALWLSPIYDSPLDDNGYDIRDYQKILAQFGTMEDFDRLLEEVHNRGMRLIMDLVINHTSDEHPWFQSAIHDKKSPYSKYYHFKKGPIPGKTPNNWTSFFSGSAWNYYEEIDKWALHLFSKKQMDLNWENPKVRADICNMIRWWLKKGVDGFRMDVINYISKTPDLPNGNTKIGNMMGYCGIEHYFYGPKLHEYLKQIRREAFEPFHAFSVGETPGVGMEMAKLLTGDDRKELDMIFSFDHLENPGKTRFDEYEYDLNYLKSYLIHWTENYGPHCWQSLFFENHDNPRMISKVSNHPEFRTVIGKLLATVLLTLKGTPFIFQGQEWGSVNVDFKNISEIKDVESKNLYEDLCKKMSPERAFKVILAGSREHARVLLDWNDEQKSSVNEDSIYHFYKSLIQLRNQNKEALVYGTVEFTNIKKKDYFGYFRKGNDNSYFIECNLGGGEVKRPAVPNGYEAVLSNYSQNGSVMKPYETVVYKKAK